MLSDIKLWDEDGRVAALRRFAILDTPPESAFDEIAALAQDVLRAPMVAIMLVDRHRQFCKAARGLGADETARLAPYCETAIRQQETLVVTEAVAPVGACLAIPLSTSDGYNIGALCIADDKPRAFAAAEITLAGRFAKLAMAQLEARQIPGLDGLTGALPRRAFLAEVEKEFIRAVRYERPAALVFFDLDDFRRLNDGLGHLAGDEVLRAIALRCREEMRQNDGLGRIGGEAFGLLLPETAAYEALQCAERLRLMIEKLRLKTGAGVRLVTASFGIAALGVGTPNWPQWFAQADVALHKAKQTGRNRCVLADTRPIIGQPPLPGTLALGDPQRLN